MHAYVNYLQDDWVHWLPLAVFTYNNNVHALTGIMLFFVKKCFHPSIEATVRAIPANRSIPNVTNAKAKAEKLVELQAAIEQHLKEVTTAQRKYTYRRTKRRKFEVSNIV